ncbi:MAG: CHAT domain-containing protein [Acidobacteriota bacterium]|nr:CHAT domain-containing protein [Acidobacteriota bacterium]
MPSWLNRAGLTSCLLLFAVLGCRSSADGARDFGRVRSEFLHGNLAVAQGEAAAECNRSAERESAAKVAFCLLDGEILSFQGRSADVVELLGRDDERLRGGGDSAIKRKMLLSLARARLGQTAQSDADFREAERLSAAGHSELEGEVLRVQGILESRRGQDGRAEECYRRSLAMARDRKDEFLEATDLLNLGFMALKAEHYDEALDRFKESSQLARVIDAHIILQTDLGNAGWTYYRLGDFEKALASFQQAEEQAKRLGATDNQIRWLNSAGLALYQMGEVKQAQSYYQESLRAAELSHNAGLAAEARVSLGLLWLETGGLVEAKTQADAALISADQVGEGEPEVQLLEGLIAVRRHDVDQARRWLSQVYGEAALSPSLRWKVEDAFANMYWGERRAKEAERWYRKSIATFEVQRSSVRDEESRLPFFANGDALYRDYAECLIGLQRSGEALQLLDLARARTLEEGLSGGRGAGFAWQNVPGRVAKKDAGKGEDHSRSAWGTTARTAVAMGTRTATADATAELTARERETARFLEASRERTAMRLDVQEVARKLNGTVLFYSLGRERSYLWTVQKGATHLFVLPPEPEIASRVKRYQAMVLKSGDPLRDGNADAAWLYGALVAPAEGLIAAGSKVFVIPSGSLSGLNFETLLKPGRDGMHYWIEDVSVTNASSVRLLARFTRNGSGRWDPKMGADRLLLMGNPVSRNSEYPALPNAAVEVDRVGRYFPAKEKTVLTQLAATPGAYAMSHPEQYAYLHFVAHGIASSVSPLDSAVVLSAPGLHPDDFKLYARDVVRQPLHARLVTISACYGSGLRTFAGEGLVGLSWAFLRAGAHLVIGTLWEANDAATPEVMDRMYGELAQGKEPDEALRAAKLSLLRTQGVYRKPLYWAPFQLYAGS